jgi:predicted SAM-dependent methyltransferase
MSVVRWLQRKFVGPVRVYFKNAADIRRLSALQKGTVRLVIGASGETLPGWVETDQRYLDLLKPADWERFFEPGNVQSIFAEHVWEHLTPDDALAAARTCYRFLAPGGCLRVAVPDGLHPDPVYVQRVRPGGSGGGAADHKVLYDYKSFSRVFEATGFRVELLEYFDGDGTFHGRTWSDERGHVRRSSRYDERNAAGTLAYTSVILDALK